MKLGFEEQQATYQSESQNARVLTESWFAKTAYCPNCGANRLGKFANNSPVADFFCVSCNEQFELKSQRSTFGARIVDGAYKSMLERLASTNNPSLFLLRYESGTGVRDLIVVPKQYFVPEIIEARKPLARSARRAGWTGCNIVLGKIPAVGKIVIVKDRSVRPPEEVVAEWNRGRFLQRASQNARGWLLAVMMCIERIGKTDFSIDEVYAQDAILRSQYPNNNHVREKIRQQLQILRDSGYIEFRSRGLYRLTPAH